MARRATVLTATLLALGLVAGRALAQDAPEPETAKAAKPAAKAERTPPRPDPRYAATSTLRVQLVISRYQNDKKQASLPYTFLVAARPSTNPGGPTVRIRMGVDTPVPVVKFDEADGKKTRVSDFQYRNVGTNIDCRATDFADGSYQLSLSVDNSSAMTGPGSPDQLGGAPLFRRFETFIDPILRDGQTIQTVAATDPVSGEVVRIDVTLNVVK